MKHTRICPATVALRQQGYTSRSKAHPSRERGHPAPAGIRLQCSMSDSDNGSPPRASRDTPPPVALRFRPTIPEPLHGRSRRRMGRPHADAGRPVRAHDVLRPAPRRTGQLQPPHPGLLVPARSHAAAERTAGRGQRSTDGPPRVRRPRPRRPAQLLLRHEPRRRSTGVGLLLYRKYTPP